MRHYYYATLRGARSLFHQTMKLIATLIVALFVSIVAFAGEPERHVRFEVLIVRQPEARAVELMPLLRDPATATAAQTKIISVLGKEAELVDWPIVTAEHNQQAVVENVHELRYAAGYDQPTVLVQIPETAGPDKVAAPTAPAQPAEQHFRVDGELKLAGGSPTTFEMKKVGTTLELLPAFSAKGKQVGVQLSLTHTSFTGWRKIVMELSPTHKVTVEQPGFQVIKTETRMKITGGKPVLLSFNKVVESAGIFELAILTATIVDDTEVEAK